MKCPLCFAPTDVKETRLTPDQSVQRYRKCFNNHTFKTVEKAVSIPREKKSRFKE